MRLSQINNNAELSEEVKPPKSDNDTKVLEEIMHDMHKTLLVADTLMRRLEQIIEKY